ncbi:hypothetical protein N7456_006756 [Penicillium angulare]|uniref:Uncharacterized protein n=1 Tax=Penicillium angulare TaxID=116970 RepID=A0A9W9FID6_9EURO|nr:hypothetical protein N7456_006756 [Penicillium angulare]
MAAGPEDVASTILAFNDILNFEKAYEWDKKQILDFIDHVAHYSYLYDTHPEDRDALKTMNLRSKAQQRATIRHTTRHMLASICVE